MLVIYAITFNHPSSPVFISPDLWVRKQRLLDAALGGNNRLDS